MPKGLELPGTTYGRERGETDIAVPGPPERTDNAPRRTVILNFHGVGLPRRSLEPDEDRWWIGRDALRTILDAVAAEPASGGPAIRLTVDDGNASDLDVIAPELAARGLTATFFVLAGRLGLPGSLSAAGLRELRAAGHEIGTHGYDHRDWRRLDEAGAAREFDEARRLLEDAAGVAVREIAVPFGAYDRSVLRRLATRDYAAVHTSDRGTIRGAPWLRPRNCVRRDMPQREIEALLAGREGALRRLRRLCGVARKRYLS